MSTPKVSTSLEIGSTLEIGRFAPVLKTYRIICGTCLLFLLVQPIAAQTVSRRTSLTILDFGNSSFAATATEQLRTGLKAIDALTLVDSDLGRAAAKGVGYSGSLNMMISEARDLGAALSSDFYLIGDAQTIRRSSSAKPVFYESYCSVFVISSRSGRLAHWERLSIDDETPSKAEEQLLNRLSQPEFIQRVFAAIKQAQVAEQAQRSIINVDAPLIEEAPDDEKIAQAQGLRLPKPFRRLRPEYPQSAAKADAEATVDVVVDVGANGEVGNIEVVRWAGFGLDEATVATVRQLHFFPAMRNGTPVPLRVLLRYNFRKPPR
ncbi:MAG TPA: energy transducer TonB [Pyrinomonadaceae bacterium]|nr:energy transducer TonB [Pyrinomonadaceae bacterium]